MKSSRRQLLEQSKSQNICWMWNNAKVKCWSISLIHRLWLRCWTFRVLCDVTVTIVIGVITPNNLLIAGRSLCTELVFDLFICPAVIDPMIYGLTADITVSHIARHNLFQVARILQVLSKGQRSQERFRVPDLYSLFEEVRYIYCLSKYERQ